MVLNFKRKAMILGGALIVLVVVYVLGIVFSPANISKRLSSVPLYPDLEKTEVQEITLDINGDPLQLSRSTGAWTVRIGNSVFPASEPRIDAFLDQLASVKRAQEATRNPDLWADFELSDDSARRITLRSGSATLVDLRVGKTDVGDSGNYVREADDVAVVLADRSLDFYLNAAESFWSHLRVFPEDLESDDIIRISLDSRLRFDDQEEPIRYTLVRSERQWQVLDSDLKLSDTLVDRLAGSLAGFEGTEFILPEQASGLDEPMTVILFTTEDDRTFRLNVGAPVDGGESYTIGTESSYQYLGAEWRLKNLIKALSDLTEE